MHLTHLVVAGLCVAAGRVFAAPQAPAVPPCVASPEYKDIIVSEPYELPPRMAVGQSCNAYHDGGCEIAMSRGHTVTVEHSVGVGFGGGLDLSKIFTAGLEAGYSISWSTSDETTAATTVICEQARYDCGMMVWPTVVKITGKVSDSGACEHSDPNKFFDFEVIAPYMEDTDLADNLSVVARFSACYIKCANVDECNKVIENGLPQCPTDRAPGQWTNHFGGKPGYITPEEAEANRQQIQDELEGQE